MNIYISYYPKDYGVALGPFKTDGNQAELLENLFTEWGEGEYKVECDLPIPMFNRKGYLKDLNKPIQMFKETA